MAGKQNEIARVLMERDGMTEQEAIERMDEVRGQMLSAIDECDYIEATAIFEDELGLELDYIFDLL